MCNDCGCNVTHGNQHLARQPVEPGSTTIDVLQRLLSANDAEARHNRAHFDAHQVFAVNLMSSPGAGKTSLLESTILRLRDEFRIAVIEGDLETENDAQRIRAHGVPAVQITTGTACHLDAHMVHHALHQIDLDSIDLLFIENVGNLVCPAGFDLGQHRNITLLSVTEGDDKPAKYPVIFRSSDLVLLSKIDLAGVMPEFNAARAIAHLRALGSAAPALALSARNGDGMAAWLHWLRAGIASRSAISQAAD